MIAEVAAVVALIIGVVIAALSLYAIAGWPAVGLLSAVGLLGLAGLLGSRPDKPL